MSEADVEKKQDCQAESLKIGKVRVRNNITRKWTLWTLKMFDNGMLQIWDNADEHCNNEYNIADMTDCYLSKIDKHCLCIADKCSNLPNRWKLKLIAMKSELLEWAKIFIQHTTNLSTDDIAFWQNKFSTFELQSVDIDSATQRFINVSCESGDVPTSEHLDIIATDLNAFYNQLTRPELDISWSKEKGRKLMDYSATIQRFVMDFIDTFLQINLTPEILRELLIILQEAVEVSVICGHIKSWKEDIDATNSKILNILEIKVSQSVVKSVSTLMESLFGIIDLHTGAPIVTVVSSSLIIDALHSALEKTDELSYVFEEYTSELDADCYLCSQCAKPFSDLVLATFEQNLPQLSSDALFSPQLTAFVEKCQQIFVFLKVAEIPSAEQQELMAFHPYVSLWVQRLDKQQSVIENAIQSDPFTLTDSCFDSEQTCYYGTSMLDTISILDPIMGSMKKLPMCQDHIIQMAEFFGSVATHYVLCIGMAIASLSDRFTPNLRDQVFVYIGTLFKARIAYEQYLNKVNFQSLFDDAERKSNGSIRTSYVGGELTGVTPNNRRAEVFICRDSISPKLRCEALFAILQSTIDDAAKSLAAWVCRSVRQTIQEMLWRQPITEMKTQKRIQTEMTKKVYAYSDAWIRKISTLIPKEFSQILSFDVHRHILKELKLQLTPGNINQVLNFVQTVRSRYILHSCYQSYQKYSENTDELRQCIESKRINNLIELHLLNADSLREKLETSEYEEMNPVIELLIGSLMKDSSDTKSERSFKSKK